MTDRGTAEFAARLAAHPWQPVGRVEEQRHVADLLADGGHVMLSGSAGVVGVDRSGADGAPPLVVIDDAHLLDDAGSALELHVALRVAASVLVTLRSGEPVPDPDGRDLEGRRRGANRHAAAVDRDAAELLEQTLDGPVDAKTRQRLFDASQGNVLLLGEIVLAGARSGQLACRRAQRWVNDV